MHGDRPQGMDGYLRMALRDGVKPFLYRSSVLSLLGVPDGRNENRARPPVSSPVGFVPARQDLLSRTRLVQSHWSESDWPARVPPKEEGKDPLEKSFPEPPFQKRSSPNEVEQDFDPMAISRESLGEKDMFFNEIEKSNKALSTFEHGMSFVEPNGSSNGPVGPIQMVRINVPGTSTKKQDFPLLSSSQVEDGALAYVEERLQEGGCQAGRRATFSKNPASEEQDHEPQTETGPETLRKEGVHYGTFPHDKPTGGFKNQTLNHNRGRVQSEGLLFSEEDPRSGNQKPPMIESEKSGPLPPPQTSAYYDRVARYAANPLGGSAASTGPEEGGGLPLRQSPTRFNPVSGRAVGRSSTYRADKIEKLSLAVQETASREPAEQDRTEVGTIDQRKQHVPAMPPAHRQVIILKDPLSRGRAPQAYWERGYLGRFHLRPLR
jgi:hypothetical protein